jgi:hypothetical protein
MRIADAFETGTQYTRETLHAYDLFIDELLLQWEYVLKSGLHIEPWQGEGDAYKSSADLFADVYQNNHMYFFLTSQGFGSASETRHPLLYKSGYYIGTVELVYNDIFRIVHDYFGHCIYGFQFGLKGETNAWQSHLAMFHSKGAKRALTNETQGQTAFYQAGKHLRRVDGTLPLRNEPDFIPYADRPFAEQRVQLLSVKLFTDLAQF